MFTNLAVLTPEQVIVMQARLKEAEQAYHQLMTGGAASVVVDQNGERVEFSRAKSSDLYSYIVRLKSALNPVSPQLVARPATFSF